MVIASQAMGVSDVEMKPPTAGVGDVAMEYSIQAKIAIHRHLPLGISSRVGQSVRLRGPRRRVAMEFLRAMRNVMMGS